MVNRTAWGHKVNVVVVVSDQIFVIVDYTLDKRVEEKKTTHLFYFESETIFFFLFDEVSFIMSEFFGGSISTSTIFNGSNV